jgi:hypothetical protein
MVPINRLYQENMLVPYQTNFMKLHVSGNIMVDARTFRETSLNHSRLETTK